MIESVKELQGLLKLKAVCVLDQEIKEIEYFQNFSYSLNSDKHVDGIRIRCYEMDNNRLFICEVIRLIQSFTHLRTLNLSINKLHSLRTIRIPVSLIELYLINCGFKQIELEGTENLELLDLSRNKLYEYNGHEELKKLKYLNLSYNDIDKFKLNNNSVEFLNIEVNPLKKLFILESFNLKILKTEYTNVKDLTIINFNSFEHIPKEIYSNGNRSIIEWLAADRNNLNEIKINLVGDPKAGKSSLLKRLKDNTYDKNHGQTDGINIEILKFGELITFNGFNAIKNFTGRFWDFGGQETLNSSHKYFFSNRTIYLLLLEARADVDPESNVDLWIKKISTYAANSQIIVVVNKIDLLRSFELDSVKLLNKYPQIIDIVYISCENNEGIHKLKEILDKTIPSTKFFRTEIDRKWIKIKEKLEKYTSDRHYINESGFEQICNEEGVLSKEERKDLIEFLHDLGIVLHFNQLFYTDLYVLNPFWITAGTYRILTSPLAAIKKGKISINDVLDILNIEKRESDMYLSEKQVEIKFTINEAKYLIESMSLFRLAHFDSLMKTILIPGLLSKKSPNEVFNSQGASIHIAFDFEFLPEYVIHNLILDLQGDIFESWRTGCIIKSKESLGEISCLLYSEKNLLIVKIFGSYPENAGYLSILRFLINGICERNNLKYKLQVALEENTSRYVEYSILLNMRRNNIVTYKDWNTNKTYNIDKLLIGIEKEDYIVKYSISDDARQSLENLEKMYKQLYAEMNRSSNFMFDIIQKLDKLSLDEGSILSIVNKLNISNNYVELVLSTFNRAIELIDQNNNLNKDLINEWKLARKEIDSVTEAKAKLILSIPFLLPILKYEKELSFDIKEILSGVAGDIERGWKGKWVDTFIIRN